MSAPVTGLISVVLGVVALFGACNGGSTPSPDGGSGGGVASTGGGSAATGGGVGGGSTVDAGLPSNLACSTLNSRRCAYLSGCGLIGADQLSDCLSYYQTTWCGPTTWQTLVSPSVATLRYDPLAAQTCADGWLSQSCADYESLPTGCDAFLQANAVGNQACYGSYDECVSGVCRGSACPRSCQPLGLSGDGCVLDDDCSAELFCKLTVVSAGSGTCTPRSAVGGACAVDVPCQSGLSCAAGFCVATPGSGQACLAGGCDVNDYCVYSADGGVCGPRKGLDQSCQTSDECLSSLLCQALTGKCSPRVLTMQGSVCSLQQACPVGTVCKGASAGSLGQCAAPVALGGGCQTSIDCSLDQACSTRDGGIDKACGPRVAAGGNCTDDRECELFDTCRQSTCVPLPKRGQACGSTRRCLQGPCVSSDGGYVCTDPLGPGGSCSADPDCASGHCVRGQCLPSCTP